MSYSLPIAPNYRRAVFEALILQTSTVVLSGFMLDSGQALQICGIALAGFWMGPWC